MTLERLRAQLSQNPELYPSYGPTKEKANTVEGLVVGAKFRSRKELYNKGVHAHLNAGISGNREEGARSVVVSGRYPDKDEGNVIIYTGTGGQKDSFSAPGPQIEDQSFDHQMNRHLQISRETGRPIRVIRGRSDSKYAPSEGYRYDGLYKVTDAYLDKSEEGFALCRFRLERLPDQPPIPIRRVLYVECP